MDGGAVDLGGGGGSGMVIGRSTGRNEVLKPNCYIVAGLCYFI